MRSPRFAHLSWPATPVIVAAMLAASWMHEAHAGTKTVCTITVNSADEKEMFRRSLPPDKYTFVELVEQGRPDWLESACRQGVRCDALVISGHYDGGNEFFSDQLEAREYLPVDEMERVSCSDSCPGLFSQLKEVYLFGCNTLNVEAVKSASGEIARSLVRTGYAPAVAARLSRTLGMRHGESSRDRMQQIFQNVPVIYGFSSVAPVGTTAAPLLGRYFRAGGGAEVAGGRASAKLVEQFRAHSMVTTRGMSGSDPQAAHRQDVCRFADDRLSTGQKLEFVHQLLGRDMAEVRLFLDRIEKLAASMVDAGGEAPAMANALEAIARDDAARERYLAFARDADQPSVRARMLGLARKLGWLTLVEQRAELMRMIDERLASPSLGAADVDLVCTLNEDRRLDAEVPRLGRSQGASGSVPYEAVMACLGNAEGHGQTLRALTSQDDAAVAIAQVYLRHRPIAEVDELRMVTTGIARMRDSAAQVRALNTLASHRLSDADSIEELARLFPVADSVSVQAAIAGVLIRSDYELIETTNLLQTLRDHRLKSGDGRNLIDVLIRRLEANQVIFSKPPV